MRSGIGAAFDHVPVRVWGCTRRNSDRRCEAPKGGGEASDPRNSDRRCEAPKGGGMTSRLASTNTRIFRSMKVRQQFLNVFAAGLLAGGCTQTDSRADAPSLRPSDTAV